MLYSWIYIYIFFFLLDILVCSIIEYFNQPVERVKMQTMSKTTWQLLSTKTPNKLFIIQLLYFISLSYTAGKVKQIEKQILLTGIM